MNSVMKEKFDHLGVGKNVVDWKDYLFIDRVTLPNFCLFFFLFR